MNQHSKTSWVFGYLSGLFDFFIYSWVLLQLSLPVNFHSSDSMMVSLWAGRNSKRGSVPSWNEKISIKYLTLNPESLPLNWTFLT